MKNGLDKIKLTSYDDLFGSDTMEQKGKSVIEIHISDLHEFPDHPFRFEMDAEMQELVESVKRIWRFGTNFGSTKRTRWICDHIRTQKSSSLQRNRTKCHSGSCDRLQ